MPRNGPNDGKVVRNEEIADAEAVLKVHQQVDDLRLHRHIERRHRLVADDEQRLKGERPRDHDPLALAPRKLMRKPLSGIVGQPDQTEQLLDPIISIPSRMGARDIDRLRDGISSAHARIESGMGILKDELRATPHRREIGLPIRAGESQAEELQRAACRLMQADDNTPDGGFS